MERKIAMTGWSLFPNYWKAWEGERRSPPVVFAEQVGPSAWGLIQDLQPVLARPFSLQHPGVCPTASPPSQHIHRDPVTAASRDKQKVKEVFFPERWSRRKMCFCSDGWNIFVQILWRWSAQSGACTGLLFHRMCKSSASSCSKATEGLALPVWTVLRNRGYHFKPNKIVADLGWQFWPSPQFFVPWGVKELRRSELSLKK